MTSAASLPPPIPLVGRNGLGSFYEHGAHLSSWAPAGHTPVIWLSSRAVLEPGTAIRGGVPIIFPWFGAGRSGELTPAHGFARTSTWELVETGTDGQHAVAALALWGKGSEHPQFGHAFSARYEIRLGETLQLSLSVENIDRQAWSFEEALHTYLRVGDVRRVLVEGLDGCSYLDQADPHGLVVRQQTGALAFTGETDRIYASNSPIRVIDESLGRVIVIDKEHSASTVVWNPWIDKARHMSDFGDDEWPHMLCIEGGNLRDSAVSLEPGQSHTMRYSVHVEALA